MLSKILFVSAIIDDRSKEIIPVSICKNPMASEMLASGTATTFANREINEIFPK